MVAFRSRRRRTRRNAARKSSRKSRAGIHRPRLTLKAGKWYGGRGSRSLIPFGSGTRINPRRRRHGRRGLLRINPFRLGGIKSMFNRNVLMSTAKAGAGIAIGFTAMPIFYKILPAALKNQRRWLGGIHVGLGLAMAGFIRNKTAKDIGLVIAATGVYDLIAMNVDFLGLPPLRTTSELADKLIPQGAAAPAIPAEQAMGGNLQMTHYGASYPVMSLPVSAAAAAGMGANFERVGSSYPSMAYPTIGLSGDGGSDLGLDDLIN